MLISTDEFGPLAEIEAQTRDIRDFRLVLMSHPIGGRPAAEIEEKCTTVYPRLVKLLNLDER